MIKSYLLCDLSRNLNASSTNASWRVSPGKFSSTFWLVNSMALAEASTECTSFALPRMA